MPERNDDIIPTNIQRGWRGRTQIVEYKLLETPSKAAAAAAEEELPQDELSSRAIAGLAQWTNLHYPGRCFPAGSVWSRRCSHPCYLGDRKCLPHAKQAARL
jgi:hypothetical protein